MYSRQIDVMGQPIWEYSHQCDHSEFRDALSGKRSDDQLNLHRDFFMRFKCTLTSRGRSVNIKSASYKVKSLICSYRICFNYFFL